MDWKFNRNWPGPVMTLLLQCIVTRPLTTSTSITVLYCSVFIHVLFVIFLIHNTVKLEWRNIYSRPQVPLIPGYLMDGSVCAGTGGHLALAVNSHHADCVVSLGAGPGGDGALFSRCRRPVTSVRTTALRRVRLYVLWIEGGLYKQETNSYAMVRDRFG